MDERREFAELIAVQQAKDLLNNEAQLFELLADMTTGEELKAELSDWSTKLAKYSAAVLEKKDRAILATLTLTYGAGQQGAQFAMAKLLGSALKSKMEGKFD